MAKILLIELPYLGNLAFYRQLTNFDSILIEKQEFFEKSSYRNRCDIVGPNGRLTLSVPIVGGKNKKQLYKEAKISYEHPWVKDHWNSLCSSYRRSPYFEYYESKFEAIYHKEWECLYDFNWSLFELSLKLLKLDLNISFTEVYTKEPKIDIEDKRSFFMPKNQQEIDIKYLQVFEDRVGFVNNLSILDLLFNEGPNSLQLLKS